MLGFSMKKRIELQTIDDHSKQTIKMILYNNCIAFLKNGKVSNLSDKVLRKLWFGRKKSHSFVLIQENAMKLCYNDEKISREHFEIDASESFSGHRKFYRFLHFFKHKRGHLNFKIKSKILQFLGREKSIILKDLGSYFGTWILLRNSKLKINIGFSYRFENKKFVQIHSHFFFENNHLYRQIETSEFGLHNNNLDPLSLNVIPSKFDDLINEVQNVGFLIYNRSLIDKKKHLEFCRSLIQNGSCSFTFLFGTLGILDSLEPQNHFAVVFVNKTYDYVTFDDLIIYLKMGSYYIAPASNSEDLYDFGVSFTTVKGNRFRRKGIRIQGQDNFDISLKINQKKILVRFRG